MVDLPPASRWRAIAGRGLQAWFKGYLHNTTPEEFIANLVRGEIGREALGAQLRELDGHFALVIVAESFSVAAADRVRSVPLLFGNRDGRYIVSDNGPRLIRRLQAHRIRRLGALSLAMAGYTIGTDTLYEEISALAPGEFAWFDGHSDVVSRVRYDQYRAWEIEPRPWEKLKSELRTVTLSIVDKLIRSAAGRVILVPLSAGLDSRLIVSGLRHLGYSQVKCVSYGLPGNHEAAAGRKVAEALGYPWRFVPYTLESQRAWFSSADHAAYLEYADCCTAVPFEQDLPAVRQLQHDNWVPSDALIVNGNSGDFISGMHILPSLTNPEKGLAPAQRERQVADLLIGKHFRLWESLTTSANNGAIRGRLLEELQAVGSGTMSEENAHGYYEYCEFQDRQCKYVITGQRIYEYAGFDWRLPLWDCAYLDFWQTVPLQAKVGQRLYREMLTEENWGSVWQGMEWSFPRYYGPAWLRCFVRPAFKAGHAPLGRERWYRFERRFLSYWQDPLVGQALHPYGRIARDKRGARHSVAWHTEAYLREKGLTFDGQPA